MAALVILIQEYVLVEVAFAVQELLIPENVAPLFDSLVESPLLLSLTDDRGVASSHQTLSAGVADELGGSDPLVPASLLVLGEMEGQQVLEEGVVLQGLLVHSLGHPPSRREIRVSRQH